MFKQAFKKLAEENGIDTDKTIEKLTDIQTMIAESGSNDADETLKGNVIKDLSEALSPIEMSFVVLQAVSELMEAKQGQPCDCPSCVADAIEAGYDHSHESISGSMKIDMSESKQKVATITQKLHEQGYDVVEDTSRFAEAFEKGLTKKDLAVAFSLSIRGFILERKEKAMKDILNSMPPEVAEILSKIAR